MLRIVERRHLLVTRSTHQHHKKHGHEEFERQPHRARNKTDWKVRVTNSIEINANLS